MDQPDSVGVGVNKNNPVISVGSVSKTYRRGRQRISVLNDVSLTASKGEFIALVGASGSGKSTLLHIIGGLDKPTSGSVSIDGTNIHKLSDAKLSKFRNQTIGFVFQFFYLQPFLSLRRNIEIAAMPNRLKANQRKEGVEDLGRRVGLSERLKYLPKELSGGQIQRAAIARALLSQPAIILADEPTGNLDSINSQQIIKLFKSLCSELGTTVIIATHDAEIAASADRVVTIKDGAIS